MSQTNSPRLQTFLLSGCLIAWLLNITAHAAPNTPSLANQIPGGAYAFIEAAGLAEIIGNAQGSDLLNGILQSEDFANLRTQEWYQDFESSKKMAEFVLRMSLWEASSKLLGGRVGFVGGGGLGDAQRNDGWLGYVVGQQDLGGLACRGQLTVEVRRW